MRKTKLCATTLTLREEVEGYSCGARFGVDGGDGQVESLLHCHFIQQRVVKSFAEFFLISSESITED